MKRMSEETLRPAQRALLESAVADSPEEAARTRALAAGLAALSTVAPASPLRSGLRRLTTTQLVAVVAVIGGSVGWSESRPGPTASPPRVLSPRSVAEPPAPSLASVPAPLSVPEASVSAPPRASEASVSAPAPPPSRAVPPAERVAGSADPTDTLAAEVRAVREAKAALQRGDAAAALRALDTYEHIPAAGTLRPEATLLRVEALLQSGRRRDAERVADASARESWFPSYRARIDALLARP